MVMAEWGNGWGRMGKTEECIELMFRSCLLEFRHLIALGLLLYVRSRLDFWWLSSFGMKYLSFVSHHGLEGSSNQENS